MSRKLTASIRNLELYMGCAELVGHSAAAYRDESGNTHLLMFSDLWRVLNAAESGLRALNVHEKWGTGDDPDGKIRKTSDYTELSARMAAELRKGA